MSRCLMWSLALALAALFCLNATPVRADSNLNVALDFTIPPASHGSTVTEQFDAVFNYDLTTGQIIPGTLVIDASGPLASFYPLKTIVHYDLGSFGYPQINWYDTAGDQIQFDYGFDHNTSINVGVGGGQMFWVCGSPVCIDNFGGSGNSVYSLVVTDPRPPTTPEPSTWVMLLTGMLAVVALERASARISGTGFSRRRIGERCPL